MDGPFPVLVNDRSESTSRLTFGPHRIVGASSGYPCADRPTILKGVVHYTIAIDSIYSDSIPLE
jgi:hypothetical protein